MNLRVRMVVGASAYKKNDVSNILTQLPMHPVYEPLHQDSACQLTILINSQVSDSLNKR